jgi:hypothetical protein
MFRVVLPALAATVVTGSVVGSSLLGQGGPPASQLAGADIGAARSSTVLATADDAGQAAGHAAGQEADARERLGDRDQRVSRSAKRVTIVEKPVATDHRFSTVTLKIRQAPAADAGTLTTVDPATKLPVTGEVKGDYAEVIWDRQSYWVSADYLADEKPEPEAARSSDAVSSDQMPMGGFSMARCAYGSDIEGGITVNAVRVLRAVCAEFPQIMTYGGWRGDGEHVDGRAIDIIVSGDRGWQVAHYLRANAGALRLYDIIYSQRIWTDQRSAEGWRWLADRGSVTANHYDHVHVKVH